VLATLKARRDREEGFTLIELMVVVLIIAILIAIAIPTFLGARQRAQDRAAQSSARNALTASKTLFTDKESYTGIDAAALKGVEPSLDFAATSSGQNEVGFVVSQTNIAGDTITLGVLSKSNKCFFLQDVSSSPGAGTFYAEGTPANGVCTPTPNMTWVSSW
jgi:type IV pilus assembly protein PilA